MSGNDDERVATVEIEANGRWMWRGEATMKESEYARLRAMWESGDHKERLKADQHIVGLYMDTRNLDIDDYDVEVDEFNQVDEE